MPRFDRVLIIGASSGIGKALAVRLLQDGSSVAMVARRPSMTGDELRMINGESIHEGVSRRDGIGHSPRAFVYQHDVTDYDKTASLFQQIVRDLSGLDLIIYSAGMSYEIDLDEFNFKKDRET